MNYKLEDFVGRFVVTKWRIVTYSSLKKSQNEHKTYLANNFFYVKKFYRCDTFGNVCFEMIDTDAKIVYVNFYDAAINSFIDVID